MKPRAAAYARISQEDKAVPKVEIQVEVASALAVSEHSAVMQPAPYVDNGIPATGRSITEGTRHKRPAFDRLVTDAENGVFDMIVATSGDRLARNYPDGMALVAACVQGGVVIVTEDEGLVDPSTPGGEEVAMSLFVGGRKEIRSRTAKQRRRYDRETAAGKPLWGGRTFGFAAQYEENAHGRLTKRWVLHEPAEADAIRWAVKKLLEEDCSIGTIQREFERRGLMPVKAVSRARRNGTEPSGKWANATIRTMLMNPRLAGLVARDGVIQEKVVAKWEEIITRDQHEAVVAKLTNPSRRKTPGPEPKSLGTGLVMCSCGTPMRSTTANGKPGLRCNSDRLEVSDEIKAQRHRSIETELVDPLIARAVASAFLFGPADLLPEEGVDITPLEIELGKIREERDRLRRWVADDLMPEGEAVPQLRKIRLRESEIQEEIASARSASLNAAMTASAAREVLRPGRVKIGGRVGHEGVIEARDALEARFHGLDLDKRRELVRALLDVRVGAGRGSGRVSIQHKVVTSLNDP